MHYMKKAALCMGGIETQWELHSEVRDVCRWKVYWVFPPYRQASQFLFLPSFFTHEYDPTNTHFLPLMHKLTSIRIQIGEHFLCAPLSCLSSYAQLPQL